MMHIVLRELSFMVGSCAPNHIERSACVYMVWRIKYFCVDGKNNECNRRAVDRDSHTELQLYPIVAVYKTIQLKSEIKWRVGL